MGWRRAAFLATIGLLAATCPCAADLKIATWNLNWLTVRPAGAPGLPPDLKPRTTDDFDRLRAYALELAADVVAIEEVDGYDAARRVFPPETYVIHMTRDRVSQRVGMAIRRGLRHDMNPEVPLPAASEPDLRLRSGLDVTLRPDGPPLRLLAVHMKQGCMNPRLDRKGGRDCRILAEQAAPLAAWIAARRQEGIGFVILGDFNRWMDGRDPFLATLRQAAPLLRATEGFASRCWRDEAFIDHILLGGPAQDWVTPNSLRVFRYREAGPEWAARLSDHCPVSVRLTLPAGPAKDTRDDP